MTLIQPGDKVLVGESKHEYRVASIDYLHARAVISRADGKPGTRSAPLTDLTRVRPTLIEAVWAAHKESA